MHEIALPQEYAPWQDGHECPACGYFTDGADSAHIVGQLWPGRTSPPPWSMARMAGDRCFWETLRLYFDMPHGLEAAVQEGLAPEYPFL